MKSTRKRETQADSSSVPGMWLAAHIDESRLETYARLQRAAPAQVRLHLALCQECRDRMAEMHEFVLFLRSDPEETAGHIYYRHQLEGGTLFLSVTGSDSTGWTARGLGAGFDVARRFERGGRAKSWIERWFRSACAEHVCSRACGHDWK